VHPVRAGGRELIAAARPVAVVMPTLGDGTPLPDGDSVIAALHPGQIAAFPAVKYALDLVGVNWLVGH
jgi:hypothetical protein